MCVVAAIGGAAAIGGIAQGIGAKKASQAQTEAANAANNQQMQMFQQAHRDLAPYNVQGQAAAQRLGSILGLPGSSPMSGGALQSYLTGLPGYQFQFGQGLQALDRSAAARGMLGSGGYGKALTRYGQGYASNYLQNYTGQLAGLAGLGESAAAGQGQAGVETGRGLAATTTYGGNAAAAGSAGIANAFTGAINQGAGLYGMYQGGFFGRPGGGGGGGGGYIQPGDPYGGQGIGWGPSWDPNWMNH